MSMPLILVLVLGTHVNDRGALAAQLLQGLRGLPHDTRQGM
jgi:hypothetical protein